MTDTKPASPGPLITVPSEHSISYEMDVEYPKLRTSNLYTLHPWIRIVADEVTEEVKLAAGIRAIALPVRTEDDGA